MNTQLSSYTQLRHDNLLYAKPSYTGATTICSYPYSFVEPYPEFYKQIALFADSAKTFFSKYTTKNSSVINYFDKLNSIMSTLEDISRKEISDQTLTVDEISFLKKMYSKNEDNMCGAQPISGWYYDLLFGNGEETIIADIHTQPTDSDGNMVGKVLHIATGKVNLGIFLASSTFPNKHNIVFVGPVMSYYEKTTENFNRNTDQDWQTAVANGNSGYRPDWVNIYLADKNGKMLTEGRVLPYMIKDWVDVPEMKDEKGIDARIYPNPFYNNPFIIIKSEKAAVYSYSIYDQCGKIVYQSELKRIPNGKTIDYFNNANLKQGFYICNVKLGSTFKNIKFVKQ